TPKPRVSDRTTESSTKPSISAMIFDPDPATPKPRVSDRTTESSTKPSISAMIFDPGVPYIRTVFDISNDPAPTLPPFDLLIFTRRGGDKRRTPPPPNRPPPNRPPKKPPACMLPQPRKLSALDCQPSPPPKRSAEKPLKAFELLNALSARAHAFAISWLPSKLRGMARLRLFALSAPPL